MVGCRTSGRTATVVTLLWGLRSYKLFSRVDLVLREGTVETKNIHIALSIDGTPRYVAAVNLDWTQRLGSLPVRLLNAESCCREISNGKSKVDISRITLTTYRNQIAGAAAASSRRRRPRQRTRCTPLRITPFSRFCQVVPRRARRPPMLGVFTIRGT